MNIFDVDPKAIEPAFDWRAEASCALPYREPSSELFGLEPLPAHVIDMRPQGKPLAFPARSAEERLRSFRVVDTMSGVEGERISKLIAEQFDFRAGDYLGGNPPYGIHFWSVHHETPMPSESRFRTFEEACRSALQEMGWEALAEKSLTPRVRVEKADKRADFGIGNQDEHIPLVSFEYDERVGVHVMTSVLEAPDLLYILAQ